MDKLCRAFLRLNEWLLPPRKESGIIKLHGLGPERYILALALQKEYRVLARLLPLRPAMILAGIVQWVSSAILHLQPDLTIASLTTSVGLGCVPALSSYFCQRQD